MTIRLSSKLVGAAAWLACQLLAASSVQAQEMMLAPSSALACLTRVAGAPATPVYPPELFERKDSDVVRVVLEFRGPDQAPKVKLDGEYHFRSFRDAVEDFVAAYRVPCMAEGAPPVTLKQDFVFTPTDGRKVMPPPVHDVNDDARAAQMKCIVHVDKKTRPDAPFAGTNTFRREQEEENVAVRMIYLDANRPPELVFLTEPHQRALRRTIERFAEGLRMPCLTRGQVEVNTLYKYVLQNSARTLLKDMTLVQMLAGGKDYARPAYFDFNTMSCPFDVRLRYLRPYMPNGVRELENSNPARKPLLEWMSKITLNVDDATNRKVLGSDINVTIPCGKLDLPQESVPAQNGPANNAPAKEARPSS